MNKIGSILLIIILSVCSQVVSAQVERSQLTSSIENREPTDDLEGVVQGQFNQIKRVYFFTQVSGLANQQITHRWLFEGE